MLLFVVSLKLIMLRVVETCFDDKFLIKPEMCICVVILSCRHEVNNNQEERQVDIGQPQN